jgi:hypothetical protein
MLFRHILTRTFTTESLLISYLEFNVSTCKYSYISDSPLLYTRLTIIHENTISLNCQRSSRKFRNPQENHKLTGKSQTNRKTINPTNPQENHKPHRKVANTTQENHKPTGKSQTPQDSYKHNTGKSQTPQDSYKHNTGKSQTQYRKTMF